MKNYYYKICMKDFNMMGPNPIRLLEEQLISQPLIRRGMRVLDLGCGKGLTSLYIAKETEAIVYATDLWIDASENYQRIKEWGMENYILPFHANVENLPFANEYFDALVCIDAYEYFGAKEGFFDEILNYVKPGGYVFIAIPGLKDEFEGNVPDIFYEWEDDESEDFHEDYHCANWWKSLIEKSNGIEEIYVKEMSCFDLAWQEWFASKHEYAIRDKQFFERGLGKLLNFISIIIKKQK